MSKAFASQGDTAEKKVDFVRLSDRAYAYTAEGDPNSGVVVGDDAVMVFDAQATPVMAREVVAKIREVTDKPVRFLVLSHYHAVRVMGASAYNADEIIASDKTRDLIDERGEADFHSEVGRFPRLFRAVEEVPGLTHPTRVFSGETTVDLGGVSAQIVRAGRGHTAGDTVVWLPSEKVLFAGDLVERGAAPYCGDAHFADWPQTIARLRKFGASAVVPGRGPALTTPDEVAAGFDGTERFVSKLFAMTRERVAAGKSLGETYREVYPAMESEFGEWFIFAHCMPFNASRAYDEAGGLDHPRIWTAERDREMWTALEGGEGGEGGESGSG